MEADGVDTAPVVVPGVLPHGRKDVDRRHFLHGVETQRLVQAADREWLRPDDEHAVGTEQRDVVVEALMKTHRTLEQRGAKAELHHDQQNGEGDARQRHHQAQRLVLELQPAEQHQGWITTSTCRLVSACRRSGIVQQDRHLDDARVLAGRRVGADLVLLFDFLADGLHGAGQVLLQGRTADRGALTGLHVTDIGFIHFRDRVHRSAPGPIPVCRRSPMSSPGRTVMSSTRPSNRRLDVGTLRFRLHPGQPGAGHVDAGLGERTAVVALAQEALRASASPRALSASSSPATPWACSRARRSASRAATSARTQASVARLRAGIHFLPAKSRLASASAAVSASMTAAVSVTASN